MIRPFMIRPFMIRPFMIRPFMRGRFASVGVYALALYGVLCCKQSFMSMISPASVQD